MDDLVQPTCLSSENLHHGRFQLSTYQLGIAHLRFQLPLKLRELSYTLWSNAALSQLVREPTCRTLVSRTCLDLLLVSQDHLVTHVCSDAPLGTSDHDIICARLTASPHIPDRPMYRNYWKTDLDKLRVTASSLAWGFDVNSTVEGHVATAEIQFCTTYVILVFPLKRSSRILRRPPRFTRHITSLLKERNKAWRRFRAVGSSEAYEDYKHHRNSAKSTLRTAQSDYETSLLSQVNSQPKRLFAYINWRRRTPRFFSWPLHAEWKSCFWRQRKSWCACGAILLSLHICYCKHHRLIIWIIWTVYLLARRYRSHRRLSRPSSPTVECLQGSGSWRNSSFHR